MSCKVERVSESYGVSLDERLREAHSHGKSLRELEREAGSALLRSEMERSGMDFVDGDEVRYYRVLAGDEENAVAREQLRRRLETQGVDVDEVLCSVPSYQTVRQHLQECEGVDTSREKSNETTPDDVEETVRAVEKRVENVVVKGLKRVGRDIESVHTSTLVTCECGETMGVYEILSEGCRCGGEG